MILLDIAEPQMVVEYFRRAGVAVFIRRRRTRLTSGPPQRLMHHASTAIALVSLCRAWRKARLCGPQRQVVWSNITERKQMSRISFTSLPGQVSNNSLRGQT